MVPSSGSLAVAAQRSVVLVRTPVLGCMVAGLSNTGALLITSTLSLLDMVVPFASVALTMHSMVSPVEIAVSVARSNVEDPELVVVLLYWTPVVVLLHVKSRVGISPSRSEAVAIQVSVSLGLGVVGVRERVSMVGGVFRISMELVVGLLSRYPSLANT